MKWFRKHGITIILLLIMIIGAGFLAYPSFSDWWNSFHQSRAVASYAEIVSNMNEEEYERSIQAANRYNEELAKTGILWKLDEEQEKEYSEQLNVGGSGIMGYIDIPKINVMLPIYHGVEESVLQIAIGHLPGTSLPVGGESTHCFVSGHRGLPSARLFTDIDKMAVGDCFYINLLDLTLTYEVDQIQTILPTEVSSLQIEQGKDLFTLVTCTPYGINTHRLLVRGHRIENAHGNAEVIADALQIEPIYIAPFIAVPLLFFLILGVFVTTGIRLRGMKKRRQIVLQLEDRKNEERRNGEKKE